MYVSILIVTIFVEIYRTYLLYVFKLYGLFIIFGSWTYIASLYNRFKIYIMCTYNKVNCTMISKTS